MQITYKDRDMLPDSSAACLFNHIPKCAGTTLTSMLWQCYPKHIGVHYNIFNAEHIDLSAEFFYGHGLTTIDHYFPKDRKFFYFTFLRHPEGRLRSLAQFSKWQCPLNSEHDIPADYMCYQADKRHNELIYYLGNGDKFLAEHNLFEKYAFFGLQEFFVDSIIALANIIPNLSVEHLMAKNVSPKNEVHISDLALEYFYDKNRDDIELYEKAYQEFKHRVMPQEVKAKRPSENLLSSVHVNKDGENVQSHLNLCSAVLEGEELPSFFKPTLDFELEIYSIFVSLKENADICTFFHWLMKRADKRPSCLYYAAQCAYKAQMDEHYTTALKFFEQCEIRDPDNYLRLIIVARMHIIQTLADRGLWGPAREQDINIEQWLKNLENVHPWKVRSLQAQGNLYLSIKQYEKAIQLFQSALEIEPNNIAIREDLCAAFLQGGGVYLEKAKNDVINALQVSPNEEWALRQLALVTHSQKELAEKLNYTHKALSINPLWEKGLEIIKTFKQASSM